MNAAAPAAKTYLLRSRPAAGQRMAYEQSTGWDAEFTIASAGANRRITQREQSHEQLVVTCDEILALGETPVISKRVTFGGNCWSANKSNDKPTRKSRSVYADKTVTFRVDKDGNLEQDFGVRPTRQQAERLRHLLVAAADLYPSHPIAVGQRWRADDCMRGLLGLQSGDTASTILTLKEVRRHHGREAAVIGVSSGVIRADDRGFNLELSLSGQWVIDLETGAELQIDLWGQSTVAGLPAGRGGHAAGINVTGGGTFEFHRNARILNNTTLPDAPPPPPSVAPT